jgi:Thylakoid formation protein
VGAKVKTVGEAFAEFTDDLGYAINPLYKSMITDIVGTTHLTVVCARFARDPVWSLGMMTALDLLLKNYPEPDVGQRIVSSLCKCVGLKQAEVEAEAKALQDWAKSSTREEVEKALMGEGTSTLATVAQRIKGDEYWMYSRFFGIGMLKVMEAVGIEMDKDEVYPIMEDWMSNKLGRSHLTACVRCIVVPSPFCRHGDFLTTSPFCFVSRHSRTVICFSRFVKS